MNSLKKHWFWAGIVVLLLVGLDQWTKALAVSNLEGKPAVPIIRGVFELSYTVNFGAAFSMMQNQQLFFCILTPIIMLAILYAYVKIPEGRRFLLLRVIGVLMLSGAAGNFIDRIANGYVVDFLYFKLIDFPVFNVADCYVTVAAALLFVALLFVYQEQELGFLSFKKKRAQFDEEDRGTGEE